MTDGTLWDFYSVSNEWRKQRNLVLLNLSFFSFNEMDFAQQIAARGILLVMGIVSWFTCISESKSPNVLATVYLLSPNGCSLDYFKLIKHLTQVVVMVHIWDWLGLVIGFVFQYQLSFLFLKMNIFKNFSAPGPQISNSACCRLHKSFS